MAVADIPKRQQIVRELWLKYKLDPPFLALAASQWFQDDMIHIERWLDMHVRAAVVSEGVILANDAKWNVIREQLSYPPLWLVNNLNMTLFRSKSNFMKNVYFELATENNLLYAKPSKVITESIAVDDDVLYEWLGILGGTRFHPRAT